MTDSQTTPVDRLLADPVALDQAIDGFAADGHSALELINAANAATLAKATVQLAEALTGAQSIAGRDGANGQNGANGRDGRDGRPGESIVEFRSGYDQLTARPADPADGDLYIGHAVHLTPENAEGWWIERIVIEVIALHQMLGFGATVELPEGVRSGRLRWSDRESYAYEHSDLATRQYRRYLAQLVLDDPDTYIGYHEHYPPEDLDVVREAATKYAVATAAGIETSFEKPAYYIRTAELLASRDPAFMALTTFEQAARMTEVRAALTERYGAQA